MGVTGSPAAGVGFVLIAGEVDAIELDEGRVEDEARTVVDRLEAEAVMDELSSGSCIDRDRIVSGASDRAKSFRIGAGEAVGGEEVIWEREGPPAVGGGMVAAVWGGCGGADGWTCSGRDWMTR